MRLISYTFVVILSIAVTFIIETLASNSTITIAKGHEVPILPHWKRHHERISCNHTHWLHVPKTGSSFCLSLQHVCCPVKFERIGEGITIEDLARAQRLSEKNRPYYYQSHFCYKFVRQDGHAIQHVACQFAGPVEHVPMGWQPGEHRMVMVREPRSRIVSAYLDAMHHEGMDLNFWRQSEQEVKHIRGASHEQILKKAQFYADLPGMRGKLTVCLFLVPCL